MRVQIHQFDSFARGVQANDRFVTFKELYTDIPAG